MLVYGGGRLVGDVIEVRVDDIDDARNRHPYGQSLGAFRKVVERLTRPGDLVVDPCMGGGTTLLAATSLGRHAVGCDVDAACVERVRRLLGGVTRARSGRRPRAPSATVSA